MAAWRLVVHAQCTKSAVDKLHCARAEDATSELSFRLIQFVTIQFLLEAARDWRNSSEVTAMARKRVLAP